MPESASGRLICAVGAIGYGVTSITVGIVATSDLTYESYAQFAAHYSLLPTLLIVLPPFMVTLAFPVLVAALHANLSVERRPLGLLALLFAGVYTAVLGSAYWLQLTYVPWNIMRGAGDELAPWVMWNPAGFFWAFETFGYFAMGVSCLFAGLAFAPRQVPRRIRAGLIAMGVLGLYFMSAALKDALLNPGEDEAWVTAWALSAGLAWVILFGFVSSALARWFHMSGVAISRVATSTAAHEAHPSG